MRRSRCQHGSPGTRPLINLACHTDPSFPSRSPQPSNHGRSTSRQANPVSTLHSRSPYSPPVVIVAHEPSPLPRSSAPIWRHTADLAHHINITLQGLPNWQYMLWLFLEDKEIELEKETGNQSWMPAQRQYALYFIITYTHWTLCRFSQMRRTEDLTKQRHHR